MLWNLLRSRLFFMHRSPGLYRFLGPIVTRDCKGKIPGAATFRSLRRGVLLIYSGAFWRSTSCKKLQPAMTSLELVTSQRQKYLQHELRMRLRGVNLNFSNLNSEYFELENHYDLTLNLQPAAHLRWKEGVSLEEFCHCNATRFCICALDGLKIILWRKFETEKK